MPAYLDGSGTVWSALGLLVLPGGTAASWWQAQGTYGSDSVLYDTSGNSTALGEPVYQSNGGCHIAYYPVPTEPRLTFAYYDGSNWKYAAVKDSGITSETPVGQLYKPGCSTPVSFTGVITWASPTNASVSWDLTPPTVSFVQPFHREYR
jgi:hypothetical protein